MSRLNSAALAGLAGRDIQLPTYDRDHTGVGIVHLGIGAFHRAHQALYTEAVLNGAGGDWAICGVSLRQPRVRDQLQPQDGLYCSVVKQGRHSALQVVGAVQEVLVAPEDPAAVIDRIAGAAVSVLTLTVTEKGYCLGPDGSLDFAHGDIVADLARPRSPRSALGYICAGLEQRRLANLRGLTVISCDNLSRNGATLRAGVMALAERQDPGLATWIERECTFPDSMVDKIVPATTARDLDEVERALGCRDEAAVVGEPFQQWVIQDNFAGPVPDWGSAGAQIVSDVAPFETLKLRLLNASHSAIAYLGCLAGWRTVAQAVAHPGLLALVRRMMREEIEPGLSIPAGFDVHGYQRALLARFANTALLHLTRQIAMDGSQKLPQRLFPSLQWQLDHGGPIECLSLALAAWILFTREEGLEDPLAEQILALHRAAGTEPAAYLDAMLGLERIFPSALACHQRLRETLLRQLRLLQSEAVPGALDRLENPAP